MANQNYQSVKRKLERSGCLDALTREQKQFLFKTVLEAMQGHARKAYMAGVLS